MDGISPAKETVALAAVLLSSTSMSCEGLTEVTSSLPKTTSEFLTIPYVVLVGTVVNGIFSASQLHGTALTPHAALTPLSPTNCISVGGGSFYETIRVF